MNNTYLCHHGIKGQKWGIRRFQNEDGSLTDEGKIRYNKTKNGTEYADVTDKKQIEKLVSDSSFTVEGLKASSDNDYDSLRRFFGSKGIDVSKFKVNNISGKTMNELYKLTGKNAYRDDFNLLVISGLNHDSKLGALKTSSGARWLDDIVYSNSLNEKNKIQD